MTNNKLMRVKKVPETIVTSMWLKIRDWHIAKHTADLESAFELGDLIINASIFTGLDREKVITRLRDELGELAYGESTYRRASHLVKTFTANQRKVLIEKGVSVARVLILASRPYDGDRRTKLVVEIKTGRLTDWSQIRSEPERLLLAKNKTLHPRIHHKDDFVNVQICDHGMFQRSLMQPGFKTLLTRIKPQEMLVEELNKAVTFLQKRGADVKPFRM